MTLRSELDHLVWAVPDLERAMKDLEHRLGCRAVAGGRHPGVGTRNALIDLGDRRYLEVLAPDPTQDHFTGFGLWVAELTAPRLATWALRTDDLDAWTEAARPLDLEPGEIRAMHRERPGGGRLEWRLAALGEHRGGLLPFAIEWGESHPCDDLPESGCRLMALHLFAGAPDTLGLELTALGAGQEPAVQIHAAEGRARLSVTLESPRGRLELE